MKELTEKIGYASTLWKFIHTASKFKKKVATRLRREIYS